MARRVNKNGLYRVTDVLRGQLQDVVDALDELRDAVEDARRAACATYLGQDVAGRFAQMLTLLPEITPHLEKCEKIGLRHFARLMEPMPVGPRVVHHRRSKKPARSTTGALETMVQPTRVRRF